MNHKIKTVLFKSLALLPNKLDDYCYHKIQSLFDKSSLESRIKSTESTYLRLSKVLTDLKIDLKDKNVFELGSGWFPAMPYFFKYKLTVKKVITVDINEHFTRKTVLKLNNLFSNLYAINVRSSKENKYELPEGIEYFPRANVLNSNLPDVQMFFSRYVLSHMSKEDVDDLHKKLKKELKKDSYIIHFISPSDLRQHNDSNLSMQDFLKYSESEWEKIHTKFDYHNRLRLPQFLEIFKKYDLEVLHLEYESLQKNTKKYDLFKEIKLHENFINYTDDELTAGNILVVLKV